MRTRLVGAAAAAALAFSAVMPATAGAEAPSCSWGELTATSIEAGFPQGAHSSDPSGDGHGSGTADEPRAGLANVVEQGNLNATCELIASLLQ